MVDGDCEMQPGWIEAGLAALRAESDLALVFGRCRERYPERSIYNALCDDEWAAPVGEAAVCGGNALFRVSALRQVDFYNPAMIAGEDTELSMRLRKRGWRLRSLDAEMTLHDAAITRFSQWWIRTRRSGHAYGEMAYLHPDARNPNWPRTVRSIVFWGGGMPMLLLIRYLPVVDRGSTLVDSDGCWFFCRGQYVCATYPKATAMRVTVKVARASGILLMVGKIPQFLGLMAYHRNRLTGRKISLDRV